MTPDQKHIAHLQTQVANLIKVAQDLKSCAQTDRDLKEIRAANKAIKEAEAPYPTPEPQKLIQEPTKILGIDKEQAYAEIITLAGTHLVPQPAKGCHDCVFNNASRELNKPAFEGHWCSDAPLCSDRPDHDSIIWVVKAD